MDKNKIRADVLEKIGYKPQCSKAIDATIEACTAHYESELLKRDALIAEKDKALAKIKEFSIDGVASNVATEALSLTHDSVRLVEV